MTEEVTTEVSDVWIDYFPDFRDKVDNHDAYLRAVKEAIPLILSALKFIKDKPLEHVIRIELTILEPPPIHVELTWPSGVESTIFLHDKDYGLEAHESLVGLIQIDGLYTKTVGRWMKEMDQVKGALMGVFGHRGGET